MTATFIFHTDILKRSATIPVGANNYSSLQPFHPMETFSNAALSTGDRADNHERLRPAGNRIGEAHVWRFVGEILLAGEEPYEWPPFMARLIANRSAQHRVSGFERIQN